MSSLGSAAATGLNRANQHLCRNSETLVQAADHFERERALAIHHLMNATAATDHAD